MKKENEKEEKAIYQNKAKANVELPSLPTRQDIHIHSSVPERIAKLNKLLVVGSSSSLPKNAKAEQN